MIYADRNNDNGAHKRALIAGSIGNFIEWYEFAVYVLSGDGYRPQLLSACRAPLTGLILTYASFAIAFFFRPLGAIILVGSAIVLAVNPR